MHVSSLRWCWYATGPRAPQFGQYTNHSQIMEYAVRILPRSDSVRTFFQPQKGQDIRSAIVALPQLQTLGELGKYHVLVWCVSAHGVVLIGELP